MNLQKYDALQSIHKSSFVCMRVCILKASPVFSQGQKNDCCTCLDHTRACTLKYDMHAGAACTGDWKEALKEARAKTAPKSENFLSTNSTINHIDKSNNIPEGADSKLSKDNEHVEV
jgi:hypothetical protein